MAVRKMCIELLQDIAHLGRRGNIIEVSSGQARNFLIPKGQAREVTPEMLKQIEQEKKRTSDRLRERLEKAFDIQKMLDGQEFFYQTKGKGKKMFGGLNEGEILKMIEKKCGMAFEKKDIRLPNKTHIKTAGKHLLYVHITRDTIAKIFITVTLDE